MTKLSKKPINSQEFGHYVNNLWSAFTLMDTKDDIRLLFKDLFTHTEYKMFTKRLEIARRLLAGEKYEKIIDDLKVGPRTVTSVSTTLAQAGEGLRKADEKLKALERRHQRIREKRQAILERRAMPRYKGTDPLHEVLEAGVSFAGESIRKALRHNSAKKDLLV